MKLIRSNKKGFGIHSPFVYRLVTRVLFPDAQFYIFSEIDKLKTSPYEKEELKLIFRLLNFFQPPEILYFGNPTEKEFEILSKSVQELIFYHFNTKSEFQKRNNELLKNVSFVVYSEDILENDFDLPENNSVWIVKNIHKNEELNRFFQTLLIPETGVISIEYKNFAIVIFDKKFRINT